MKSLGILYLLFITLSKLVFTNSINFNEYTQSQCKQNKLGYPCCKKNNSVVYYHDEDGDWGYDFTKNEWCGIATVQNTSQVTPKQGGNYVIYVESDIEEDDPKFNSFIQSYIDKIGQIILDNLDTFEDKDKLEQFQSEFKVNNNEKIEKIKSYKQDQYLYTYKGSSVFMAYLNKNIINDIKKLPNVSTIEPEMTGIVDDKISTDKKDVSSQGERNQSGYSYCKEGNNKVYYQDKDGDWGYDFDDGVWCIITNVQQKASPATQVTQVTPKQGGNYVIYVESDIEEDDPKFNNFIQSYIDKIGQIILDNLDTFEDKAKLEQFQSEFKVNDNEKIEKIKSYKQDQYLYTYKGSSVFMAYLNKNIIDKIRELPDVSTIEPEMTGIVDDKVITDKKRCKFSS